MRDLDQIQNYEARQQRLVENIVNSLHEATRDETNYQKRFGRIAIVVLETLHASELRYLEDTPIAMRLIVRPIHSFTNRDEERAYLLGKVLELLVGTVTSALVHADQRSELVAEVTE